MSCWRAREQSTPGSSVTVKHRRRENVNGISKMFVRYFLLHAHTHTLHSAHLDTLVSMLARREKKMQKPKTTFDPQKLDAIRNKRLYLC